MYLITEMESGILELRSLAIYNPFFFFLSIYTELNWLITKKNDPYVQYIPLSQTKSGFVYQKQPGGGADTDRRHRLVHQRPDQGRLDNYMALGISSIRPPLRLLLSPANSGVANGAFFYFLLFPTYFPYYIDTAA